MKGIVATAVIGGAVSIAAAMLPGDAGQAWGPFAVLSTGVLLLVTYWPELALFLPGLVGR